MKEWIYLWGEIFLELELIVYDYDVVDDDELIFKVSDCIEILFWDFEVSGDDGWWVGCVEG